MSLVEHAQRELNLIKCDEPEKSALLAAVEGFAAGGWSGGSAQWGIEALGRLLRFQPLSPITSNADEWQHVGDDADGQIWQCRRRHTTFSRDGGKTWYDIDDPSLNNGDVWKRDAATWEQLELGSNAYVGVRVRVKADAFPADSRLAGEHNGRSGELVVVDSGRCTVRYQDGAEFRHDPTHLEVLKTDA